MDSQQICFTVVGAFTTDVLLKMYNSQPLGKIHAKDNPW